MPEPVACKRHPGEVTRLRCATCEDPICPQCAVQTPVGQKCPDDARLPRTARATGTPKQLVWGTLYGVGAAVGIAVGLALLWSATGGFLTIIAGFAGGMGVGEAVRKGARGNGGPRFRWIAMVLAGLMVAGAWLGAFGILFPRGLSILSYPAAVWAASQRFPWR